MNQRMTPTREKIVQLLQKEHLLSAAQMEVQLVKDFPSINKTTVYRALEFLLKSGKVCQHQFDLKEAVFELKDHHHDHLICTSCLKMIVTDCKVILPTSIEGYVVDHHHLTLYGMCADCQKKKTQPQYQA